MDELKSLLLRHEGLRLKAYSDTCGKITIGVGRNIEDVGISSTEAMYLLENDITRAKAGAYTFHWYPKLDEARKDVVVSMIFNLGLGGFCKFMRLIEALEVQNYSKAADEMLDSTWAHQVGERAKELATIMRTGEHG